MSAASLGGAPDQPSSNRFRAVQCCNLIAAAAAFMGSCFAFHAFLPVPNVPDVGQKLRFFAAHKDEFDTIFVGSSHIQYGVSPVVFDQVLAENGVRSRSFNFGASGMYAPESFHLLEQILTLKSRKLKRVFLELDDVPTIWFPGDQTSQRLVYWHDGKSTLMIIRKILNLDVPEPVLEKLRLLRETRSAIALHLMLWGRNVSNLSRGLDLTESFLTSNQHDWDDLGPRRDGQVPREEEISEEKELVFQKELERERSSNLGNVALDRYADQGYRDCAAEVRRAGATPVFVVAPIFPRLPSRFRRTAPGLLLAYNKPSFYPDLYCPADRFDADHLNRVGAAKFTRLIALDFLKNARQP